MFTSNGEVKREKEKKTGLAAAAPNSDSSAFDDGDDGDSAGRRNCRGAGGGDPQPDMRRDIEERVEYFNKLARECDEEVRGCMFSFVQQLTSHGFADSYTYSIRGREGKPRKPRKALTPKYLDFDHCNKIQSSQQ